MWAAEDSQPQSTNDDGPLPTTMEELEAPKKPLVKRSILKKKVAPPPATTTTTDSSSNVDLGATSDFTVQHAEVVASEPIRPLTSSSSSTGVDRPIGSKSSAMDEAALEAMLASDNPFGTRGGGTLKSRKAPMDEAALEAMLASENPFGSRGGSSINAARAIRPATATTSETAVTSASSSSSASIDSSVAAGGDPAVDSAEFVRPNTPLTARVVDKNWRIRSDAFTQLVDELSAAASTADAQALAATFTPYLAKFLSDTHVATFERALEAVRAIVEHSREPAALAEEVMPHVMKKGLTGRSATVERSVEIVCTFIAVGGGVSVLSYLLTSAVDSKNPKLQAASVAALKTCLAAFGPKVVRLDTITGIWPSVLSATSPPVRKEAVELGCEMYRWLGAIFTQQMSALNLKEVQVKELEGLFANIPTGQARPTRFTRADEQRMAKSGKAIASEAFDPLSLVTPIDVCSKLTSGWNEFVTSNAKFVEKKERLVELCTLCEATPKILVTGATSEVVLSLAKLLADSNGIVVGEALKCVHALAKGARTGFEACARTLLAPLFSLLKEKKTNILQPVHATLDLFFSTQLEFEAMWELFERGLEDKISNVRLQNVLLLNRCLGKDLAAGVGAKSKVAPTAKSMSEMLVKLMVDQDSEVREQALLTLATLVQLVGRKPIGAALQKLELTDPKKSQRLNTLAGGDASLVGASSSSSSTPADESLDRRPSTSAGRPTTLPKKASISGASGGTSAGAGAGSLTARPSTSAGVSSSGTGAAKVASKSGGTLRKPITEGKSSSAASSATGSNDVQVNVTSYEDSVAILSAHAAIGSETVNLIASKKWNETVEGLQKLQSQLVALPSDQVFSLLSPVHYFLLKTPSYKPSNVQVTKSIYEFGRVFVGLATPFPSSLPISTLTDLFSKVSDKKFSEMIYELILSYCEAISPKVVLSELLKVFDAESKNIKSVESMISVLPRMIRDFGIGTMDVNGVIEAAKGWVTHVQKGIRDAAIPVLVEIYVQTGSMLKELILNSLKPTLVATLETEFAAHPHDTSYQPTRQVRGQVVQAKLNLDDVIPRTDISSQITEQLLNKLSDDAWKTRKEAMDEIHAILAGANHRIQSKDGGLFEALKLRLVDNNKNLAKDAIHLLSTFITDMGQPILKSGAKLLPPLLASVGDSKTFVRSEALKTLEQWIDLSGVQSVIKYLPKSLDSTNIGRKDILDLLAARLPIGPRKEIDGVTRWDLHELVLPVLNTCLDKQPDVRGSGEKVLEYVIASVGFDAVLEETKQLKKATVLQIMPTLEKYRYTTVQSLKGASSSADASAADEDAQPTTRPATAPSGGGTMKKFGSLTKKSTLASSASSASSSTSASAASSGSMTARTGGADIPPTIEEKKSSILRAKSRQSTMPVALKKSTSLASAASQDDEAIEESSNTGGVSGGGGILKKLDLNSKRLRLSKDAKRVRGIYREYSPDEIEELDQSMYVHVIDDLYAGLFHREFQKQVQALDVIEKEIERDYDAVASISDLLLKWCAWRMMDANTTLLARILPFLQRMFTEFARHDQSLSDGEAMNILPALCEKALGHNTTRFRSDTKELFVLCEKIMPVAKAFTYLVQGFESKNKRVQSECLEHVGSLLAQHGLSSTVCDPKKLLPQIGAMVGASDTGVRTAALNALGAVYATSGEEMFTLLGRGGSKEKIPPKSMAMIEERMKRIKIAEDVPNASSSAAGSAMSSAASVSSSSSAVASTPRKSVAPGLMVRKKIGATVGGTPLKYKSQTMRPGQFAAAAAAYASAGGVGKSEHDAIPGASHALISSHAPVHEETFVDESHEQPPPPNSRPLVAHTPVKPTHHHQRFHSNVAEYASAAGETLELLPESSSTTIGGLPNCFSLEDDDVSNRLGDSDGLVADIPSQHLSTSSPSQQPPPPSQPLSFQSPERAAAGGVAHSGYLSDTLIVLMESSVPANERVEALQRMVQLLSSQGVDAIVDNEEALVSVLTNELSSSYQVYPATGLVTVNSPWNISALAAIRSLVSETDCMAALPPALVEQLLEFLFAQLTDQRVLRSPACSNMVTEIDRLILKALESLPRTRAFSVTIDLLRGAMTDVQRKGQIDLVTRCLTKLLAALQKVGGNELDLVELLDALKRFTDELSPADTSHDNNAMKALLSVVHELVHMRGSDIRELIPQMNDCVLVQYVGQLLGAEPVPAAATAVESTPKRQLTLHASPVLSPSSGSLNISSPQSKLRPPTMSGLTSPAGAGPPAAAGTPSAYREKLEAVMQKAASLSTPVTTAAALTSNVHDDDDVPSSSTVSSSLTSSAPAPSPLPSPSSSVSISNPSSGTLANSKPSSLEAIRAKFKTLKPTSSASAAASVTMQEHESMQAPAGPPLSSKPAATLDPQSSSSTVAAPSTSSLLALRAKVAAMNRTAK